VGDPGCVLVTGATGFVGQRVIEAALARGWTVRAAALEGGSLVLPGGREVDVASMDLGREFDESLLDGVTAVCHLAAFIPPNQKDPACAEPCMQVNAVGTLRLLGAMARAPEKPRLVFTSTANAYAPEMHLARERDPIPPGPRAAFYFASKIAAEYYVEHYRQHNGLQAATLRLTSVYGPGMPLGGMLGQFLVRLRGGQSVQVHGGGRVRCDLVSVFDVAEAVVSGIEGRAVGTFNIGGGRVWTNGEVAGCVAALLGAPAGLVEVPPIPPGTPEDIGFPGADISRARAELGFSPTNLATGLRRMLAEDPRLGAKAAGEPMSTCDAR
jgi:nucleoside-diphosphate-sugar epimerase